MPLTPEQIEDRLKGTEDLRRRVELLERASPYAQRVDPSIALGTDLVDLGEVPAARIKQTSQQTGIVTATTTQLNMDAISYDHGGLADLSGNRILIQRGGLYFVHMACQVEVSSTGASAILIGMLFVNSAEAARGGRTGIHVQATYGIEASALFRLDLGDDLDARIHQTSGGDAATEIAANTPVLEALLVSANFGPGAS